MGENGIPVYLLKGRFDVFDAPEDENDTYGWHPKSLSAVKLCRCVESLRDVESMLCDAGHSKSDSKKKRKLKFLILSIHTLSSSLVDLCNGMKSNPEMRKEVGGEHRKLIQEMKECFISNIPLGKNGLLKEIRDKLAAHVDHRITPYESKELWKQVDSSVVGTWLHHAVNLFFDLLKLPGYTWWMKHEEPDLITIMETEPFMTAFRTKNGTITEIAGCYMTELPPRKVLLELAVEVVEKSRWMFKRESKQIYFCKPEEGEELSTYLKNFRTEMS